MSAEFTWQVPEGALDAMRAVIAARRGGCDCAESCLICGRAGSAHGKDQECPIPAFDGWIERFVPSGCDCTSR